MTTRRRVLLCALLVSASPAILLAQDTTRSQRVKPELGTRLSDPLGDGPPPAARTTPAPASRSAGIKEELVRPRTGTGEPKAIASRGAIPKALVGSWKARIATGVTYSSDGANVYRHIRPGADLDLLRITATGEYKWGKKRGKLVEVTTDYAKAGERYFQVEDDIAKYVLAYRPDGEHTLAFWTGGYLSTLKRFEVAPR